MASSAAPLQLILGTDDPPASSQWARHKGYSASTHDALNSALLLCLRSVAQRSMLDNQLGGLKIALLLLCASALPCWHRSSMRPGYMAHG